MYNSIHMIIALQKSINRFNPSKKNQSPGYPIISDFCYKNYSQIYSKISIKIAFISSSYYRNRKINSIREKKSTSGLLNVFIFLLKNQNEKLYKDYNHNSISIIVASRKAINRFNPRQKNQLLCYPILSDFF